MIEDKNFGKLAKDEIRGFEGIINGRADYITGCSQYQLVPKAVDNKLPNSLWIDEGRLTIDGEKLIPPKIKETMNFGKLAKDSISGFEGIITAVYYYNDNKLYELTPKSVDNSSETSKTFVAFRVEIGELQIKEEKKKTDKEGGPERRFDYGY